MTSFKTLVGPFAPIAARQTSDLMARHERAARLHSWRVVALAALVVALPLLLAPLALFCR